METSQEIQERMLVNVSEDYDTSEGSFIYDALKPAAIEFENQQKEVETVRNKLDIENLTDDELTRFVYTRTGINRKRATKANGVVIISGSVGSSIHVGDLVSDGYINFISLEEKTIGESGQMTVLVECEEYGSVGNATANSITVFPVTIQGLVDVYNQNAFTNGYDAESDDALRQRYYDKLQRPGKAGNKYHYREWAMEVTGTGDARVFPRYNGPLSVKVVVIDSNKQPADGDLIESIKQHIEEEMPFGVTDLSVISASALNIHLTVTLSIVDGYIESNVIETIKANITRYLKEIAFTSTFVSYAKIGSIIIDSEGVLDYENLLLNGGTSNVPIQDEQVAIMGGVNE